MRRPAPPPDYGVLTRPGWTSGAFLSRVGPPIAVAVLVACVVFFIHPYRFGVDDHAIQIPFLKDLLRPELYPDDYLIPQRATLYTYFWLALASVIGSVDAPIDTSFLVLYVVSLFFTYLAVYRIGRTLFANPGIAMLATVLFLFPQRSLASIWTVEDLMITRQVALPLVLWAFHQYLSERYRVSAALLGLTVLVHPLSAFYGGAAVAVSAIADRERIGLTKLGQCVGIVSLIAAPIVVWRILDGAAGRAGVGFDDGWVALMRLRSHHHVFPFSWEWTSIANAGVVLAVLMICLRLCEKSRATRTVTLWSVAILGLSLAGTVFSEIVLVPIVVQLQLLRSFKFIYLFAALMLARLLYQGASEPVPVTRIGALALMLLGFLYGALRWKYALLGVTGALVATKVQPGFSRAVPKWALASALLLGFTVVLSAYGASRVAAVGGPSAQWIAVQEWARTRTDPSDLFIVPPDSEGFRIHSERTSYGDWKDGTLGFFDPSFGIEWMKRMRTLGFDSDRSEIGAVAVRQAFRPLTAGAAAAIASEGRGDPGSVYVVRRTGDQVLPYAVVYENAGYVVYRVEV